MVTMVTVLMSAVAMLTRSDNPTELACSFKDTVDPLSLALSIKCISLQMEATAHFMISDLFLSSNFDITKENSVKLKAQPLYECQ